MTFRSIRIASALVFASAVSPAIAVQELKVGMATTRNAKPAFVGVVSAAYYGAITPNAADPSVQDLLTAGIGKTGLGSAAFGVMAP
jgi:3HB-oligomer hydrolase (3HBOH)